MFPIKTADPVRKSADLAGQSCGLAFHSCILGTCERWPMGVFSMTSLHACHMHYGINPVDTP